MQERKKLLLGGIALFVATPIVIFIIYGINTLAFVPHGYLTLITVPSPVSVTVNDRTTVLKTDQKFPIHTGSNRITVSSNGFASTTITVLVKDGQTVTLPVQLTPKTNKAQQEISNPKYQNSLQRISGLLLNKEANDLSQKDPIINQLPINENDYSINPCTPEDTNTIAICITSFIPGTAYMQQEAIDRLKSLGYDLSKYKIYVDGTLETIS